MLSKRWIYAGALFTISIFALMVALLYDHAGPTPSTVLEVIDEKPKPREPVRPPIPASLVKIFDTNLRPIERMRAVDSLPSDLSVDALVALRWLLQSPGASEGVRNHVALKLFQCEEPHLISDLTQMLWDKGQSPKWRNYCVQHLRTCYESSGKSSILTTLLSATKNDEPLVKTCAIWSLGRIATSKRVPKLKGEEITGQVRKIALDAIRDEDGHFLVRMAGVQTCSYLGLEEAINDIRTLAADKSVRPIDLRVVAVGALGDLGDATDLSLLDQLHAMPAGKIEKPADGGSGTEHGHAVHRHQVPDNRLKVASGMAARKIRRRLHRDSAQDLKRAGPKNEPVLTGGRQTSPN